MPRCRPKYNHNHDIAQSLPGNSGHHECTILSVRISLAYSLSMFLSVTTWIWSREMKGNDACLLELSYTSSTIYEKHGQHMYKIKANLDTAPTMTWQKRALLPRRCYWLFPPPRRLLVARTPSTYSFDNAESCCLAAVRISMKPKMYMTKLKKIWTHVARVSTSICFSPQADIHLRVLEATVSINVV